MSTALLASLAGAAAAQLPVPTVGVSRDDTIGATFRLRGEAGLAVGTPLARDANGTRVVTGLSPMAGVGFARDLARGITVAGGLRAALLSLQFRDDAGASWESGTAWQLDASAAAERAVLGCALREAAGCTAARVGAGVVFLGGPREVVPFRQSGSRWGVGGEAGAAVRLASAWPVYGTALGHAYHMFGVSSILAGPLRAGVVARVLVGVRYGR